jgi:hypothetical protein
MLASEGMERTEAVAAESPLLETAAGHPTTAYIFLALGSVSVVVLNPGEPE